MWKLKVLGKTNKEETWKQPEISEPSFFYKNSCVVVKFLLVTLWQLSVTKTHVQRDIADNFGLLCPPSTYFRQEKAKRLKTSDSRKD